MADPVTTPSPAVDGPVLDVDARFAIVPEWVLDAPISDCAVRLYAVLLRYGQTSGARMPGRSTLARRLRKQSVDTVDRAMKELVGLGAVAVEHRRDGTRQLTNRYLVRTLLEKGGRSDAATPGTPAAPPAAVSASVSSAAAAPGRNSAAGGTVAAGPGRSDAAPRAAGMRPNPEFFTQSPALPPPAPTAAPTPGRLAAGEGDPNSQLLTACGIDDLDGFAAEIQRLRRDLGQPSVRWSGPCLVAALQLAVKVRSWPATAARQALLLVAADGRTRSPMRLAEAGPWWDHAAKQILQRTPQEQAELDGLERLLADCDDRALLQREARTQLSAEGVPLNRLTVARRAARLLERQTQQAERLQTRRTSARYAQDRTRSSA